MLPVIAIKAAKKACTRGAVQQMTRAQMAKRSQETLARVKKGRMASSADDLADVVDDQYGYVVQTVHRTDEYHETFLESWDFQRRWDWVEDRGLEPKMALGVVDDDGTVELFLGGFDPYSAGIMSTKRMDRLGKFKMGGKAAGKVDDDILQAAGGGKFRKPKAAEITTQHEKRSKDYVGFMHKSIKKPKRITDYPNLPDENAASIREAAVTALGKRVGKLPKKDRDKFEKFTKALGTKKNEDGVRKAVEIWDATTVDENPVGLLMQKAVKKEFQLDDAVLGHISKKADTKLKALLKRKKLSEKQAMDGAKVFAREVYNETQEQLKKAGITEIVSYRGMSLPKSRVPAKWKKAMEEAKKRGEGYAVSIGDIELQPMTSFSAHRGVAVEFTDAWGKPKTSWDVVLTTKIPADRIISTPGSGMGCYSELEFLAMGGTEAGTTGAVFTDAAFSKLGMTNINNWHKWDDVFESVARTLNAAPGS